MKKEVIIFDLDGTLLDTLEDLTDSINFVLSEFNYSLKDTNQIQSFLGNGVYKLVEMSVPNGKNNVNYDECIKLFKEYYSKNLCNKTKPYAGILEMLKSLKNKHIKIAVVSNKFDKAVKYLCREYFKELIDIAVGENISEGIDKKPAPDSVLKILKELNLKKSEVILVGDSEVDILTAKNSGIDCICVSWGFRTADYLKNNGAKFIIDKPDEIFDFIL